MLDMPKVSVVVITYNSSKYVRETLDSIKSQTYDGPIELIVSDDCSSDNTLEICEEWFKEHASHFVRAIVMSTPTNSGICGNYNYALKQVTGEWVKYIAGDDILMPECIARFMDETKRTSDKFIVCELLPFNDKGIGQPRMRCRDYFEGSVSQQEKALCTYSYIMEGPSFFLEVATLKKMGGFDERYPLVEDYPLAMKYVFHGLHIHLLNAPLVKYREYQSVSKVGSAHYDSFWWCCYASLNDWRMKVAKRDGRPLGWWHARVQRYLIDIPPYGFVNRIKRYLLMVTDLKCFIG